MSLPKASRKKLLRELREELRYWQAQVRMEWRWLLASMAKCREIGRKMREVQKGVDYVR